MGSFARNKYQNSEAMVVSPQPMITDAVTSTLREQSFKQVVALNNGLDAMERARNISPSLIFIDESLPYLAGLDFIAAIRADVTALRPNIPIVFLSANITDQCRRVATWFQVHELIEKPFSRATVLAHAQSALQREQAASDLCIDRKIVRQKLDQARREQQKDEATPRLTLSADELKRTVDMMLDDSPTKLKKPVTVPGNHLVVGDVLNRDLFAKDGRLIIRKGVTVTRKLLEKLINLHQHKIIRDIEVLPSTLNKAPLQPQRPH